MLERLILADVPDLADVVDDQEAIEEVNAYVRAEGARRLRNRERLTLAHLIEYARRELILVTERDGEPVGFVSRRDVERRGADRVIHAMPERSRPPAP